ncbi:MAG TPA: tetratricopeptide repeat protein [Pirellulales bacterium]|jgi:tetratricopeptide (TPR) repeat protein|nr:tetratricopeptide repeat protein [Pirellulales bacterium]
MARIHKVLPWHFLPLLLLSSCLSAARAQEIGDRVAVVEDQAPIRAGSTTIDHVDRGEILTVLNKKDAWLLVSRGHAGWIEARQVLPLEKAVEALNSAAAQQPADARTRCGRARIWLGTGHVDDAIAEAGEALRLAPELAPAWLIRSAAQLAKKDFAAALIDAQSADRLAPQSPYAHMTLGDIWRDQHHFDQAIEEYTAAVALDRKNCELRLRLAQAMLDSFESAQWITAGQEFTTTIGVAEFVPACRRAARLGRAEAASKEGRFRFALEEYNELVAEKSDDVPALIGRGKVEAELHRFENAVPDLNEAVALAPKDAHCLVVRADIKCMQFNFRGAIHDLDEAVKLDPKSSEANFVRGKVLAKQKKWAPAIAAFSEAIALDPNNAPAYLARSEAYQAKGDTDLAKGDRAQVERLSPSLLVPPTGKELMEQQRRRMMDEFRNRTQSG